MRTPVDPRRVYILMYNAWGTGGVARTVVNLANRLVADREVEVISLFRRRWEPPYPLDPRIKVTSLMPGGPGRNRYPQPLRYLHGRPTGLRPLPSEGDFSRLTDFLLWRKLHSLRPGILISTRPALHLAAVRYAPDCVATVGQDHLNFPARFRGRGQARVLRAAIPKLDAYTVLTQADAEDYRRELPGIDTSIHVIRNALPWPAAAEPPPLENKVVVAAGRLQPEKGFPRLVRAYAPLARTRPSWQLHIYGEGPDRPELERLIEERGVQEHVRLMGYDADLRSVLTRSSVFVMSSHEEGFPMVLIEAMSVGVPMVSFDCPRGPAEIIDDDKNGRLVPNGDLQGLRVALRDLMSDQSLRRRLGAQALEDSRQYEMESIIPDWNALFEQVAGVARG